MITEDKPLRIPMKNKETEEKKKDIKKKLIIQSFTYLFRIPLIYLFISKSSYYLYFMSIDCRIISIILKMINILCISKYHKYYNINRRHSSNV